LVFDSRRGRLLPATTPAVAQERKEPSFDMEPHDHRTLLLTARRREQADDMYRLLNLRRTVEMAEEEIDNAAQEGAAAEEVSEPIDPDWAYRWKEKAAQISIEEMQRLWAKVLVGENNRPGSYSLRTLDLLFSLRTTEAQMIEKAATFCFDRSIMYKMPEYFATHGLPFDHLLELENMGVLAGVAGLGGLHRNYQFRLFNYPDGSVQHARALIYNSKKALLIEKGNEDIFTIPGYMFTAIGRELIQLGDFDVDVEFLKTCAQTIKNASKLKVSVTDYTLLTSGTMSLSNVTEV
jgi:Protein of unknown function (DUF2806)